MIKRTLRKLYYKPPAYFVEFFKKKRLQAKSKIIFRKYLEKDGEKKLQIGCGNNELEEWLNTDLIFKPNKVAYLDAGSQFPLPDETFDYIFSEHIFEHLHFKQGLNMLQECFRILKPGGRIRLATPDMDFLIALHDDPQNTIYQEYMVWSINQFIPDISESFNENEYLPSFVINNFFRDWGHEIIYNYEALELLLKKAGFMNIIRKEVGESEIPEFTGLERHGDIIPEEFNLLETMVIEAVR